MKIEPARLSPVFLSRIWGSRDLQPLFDYRVGVADPIGEVWLTGDKCRFASGPLAGRLLGEVWPALSGEWTGRLAQGKPRIPLLVKFIFPDDKLSLQVHPTDEYARKHEAAAGGVGKTEMWYVVSARAGAQLRLGLEPGVTRESFLQAIADGTAEQCLRRYAAGAGDAFFVPAGTVHTIGPGMVLCEVQEHSDITYRVFDYDRVQSDGKPRPLHIRQSLEVMNFGEQVGGQVASAGIGCGPKGQTYLAACPHFVVERWDFPQATTIATSPEHFELLIVMSGSGTLEWGAVASPYGPAEAWLLPASLGDYRIVPDAKTCMLRTYVPHPDELAAILAGAAGASFAPSPLSHSGRVQQ